MAVRIHLETDFSVRFSEHVFRYQIKSNASILVILGPSGYGKSTFLDALIGTKNVTGFIKYSDVWFSTDEEVNLPIEERALAWVPQSHFLFPHLTVLENLKFGLREGGLTALDAIIEALEIAPILEKRPGTISGGEAQRVAIGRALVSTLRFSDGGLLLLDEPYASLDADLASRVSRFVIDWCEERGITSVFSVHEIDRIGDWRYLPEGTISAYSLDKSESGITTKALTLPRVEKTV